MKLWLKDSLALKFHQQTQDESACAAVSHGGRVGLQEPSCPSPKAPIDNLK